MNMIHEKGRKEEKGEHQANTRVQFSLCGKHWDHV